MKLKIDMEFNERPILFGEFADYQGKEITGKLLRYYWENRTPSDDGMGDVTLRLFGKEKCFNNRFDKEDEIPHTLTARDNVVAYNKPVFHSRKETCCISSFPQDYNFLKQPFSFICGMSVPPIMMYKIATRIYEQWLSII